MPAWGEDYGLRERPAVYHTWTADCDALAQAVKRNAARDYYVASWPGEHPPELEELSKSTPLGSQGQLQDTSLSLLRVPPAVRQPDRIRVLEEGAHVTSSCTLLQRSASCFLWRRMRRGHQNAAQSTAVEALTYLLALCSSAWSTGSAMMASCKTLPLRQACQ